MSGTSATQPHIVRAKIEWDVRSLDSLASFITKGATPTTYGFRWERNGVRFLRSECVSEHGLDLSAAEFISPEAHVALRRGEVKGGDLLMTITGNIGRVVRLDVDFGVANINQHIARIRINDPTVDPDFVFHWLSQPSVRQQYLKITTGQAYPQISLQQVRDTLVPLPPLCLQKVLASAFDDVDRLVAALEEVIAKKTVLKEAVIHDLLSGDCRLVGFHEAWTFKNLGELGTFTKGKGIRKNQVSAEGLPCVRYGEIYTRHHDIIRRFYSYISSEVAAESERMRSGDLLFAGSGETAGEIGKCVAFLGSEEAYAGSDIVIFRPVGQDSCFLGYLMNHLSVRKQRARLAQGDAVVHVSSGNLARLCFQLPPVEEQRAISAVFTDLDAELEILNARLGKTRLLKQGMMQELLTRCTR
jgi:type I restriction enzyme S subunit